MKDLQISPNHTQKLRLQRALEKLQSLSLKINSGSAVSVADTIPVNHEDGVLKGHGTSEVDGEVVATVCGVVERVNKLVYVRSLRSRYKPEIGDIIVGRVTEVAQKRWRLDINFSQDAVLMISSMNMPDGLQRRRTAVDELNMRTIFEENDVVCAEVRSIQHDGGLQLQARSQKYGKLERGQLVVVPSYLVKRRKQHFHHLKEYGVDLIVGCNGYIWVGDHVETRNIACAAEGGGTGSDGVVGLERRESICRMANAVRVLAAMGFGITAEEVVVVAALSRSLNIAIYDMLGAEFYVLLAEAEAEKRCLLANKK